jgi:hypothetical protein
MLFFCRYYLCLPYDDQCLPYADVQYCSFSIKAFNASSTSSPKIYITVSSKPAIYYCWFSEPTVDSLSVFFTSYDNPQAMHRCRSKIGCGGHGKNVRFLGLQPMTSALIHSLLTISVIPYVPNYKSF